MGKRTAVGLAAVLVAAAFGLARSPSVLADDRPATWSAYAESSGIRVSVSKPAGLPTSDEIAVLSIPYARAETDSSPIGRAVASWLWPGEGVADAKSLLIVGLDPSAATSEQEQRRRRHPGTDGCGPERVLATPELTDPRTGEVLAGSIALSNPLTGQPLYDPTDNPCGEAAARTAMQTLVRERVPEYPFWARSMWPPNRSSDSSDERALCSATAAFPATWELPPNACPPGTPAARTGYAEASSNEAGDHGTSQITDLEIPGILRAGMVTSLARTEWKKNAIVSSTSTRIDDMVIFAAGGSPFINIDTVTSSATAYSDGAPSVASLDAWGVRVTIGGVAYDARIGREGVEIVDRRLPDDVRTQVDGALDRAMVANRQRIEFGDVDVDVAAAGMAAGLRREPHRATATALLVELGATEDLQGSSTVRFAIGVSDAAAITSASTGGFVPPDLPDVPVAGGGGPTFVPGSAEGRPGMDAVPEVFTPGAAAGFAAGVLPASEPIPVGVIVAVALAVMLIAGAMVAVGIWETIA